MKSKEVKDLMEAYASIYMEQEQLVESAEKYAGGQDPTKYPDKKDRKKPAPTDNKKSRPLPTPMGGKTDQLPQRTKENAGNVEYYKDDVDLFDIVKGHLMSEGFANTEEAALAIMANMSEEWRQSIVEAEVLAMKNGVPGSVKVRPALSIPGTDIGIGPNRPVPGTFTTTTPEQRAKIKSGDTHIDRGVGGMQPRQGAGPTQNERRRYNAELAKQNKHSARRMPL